MNAAAAVASSCLAEVQGASGHHKLRKISSLVLDSAERGGACTSSDPTAKEGPEERRQQPALFTRLRLVQLLVKVFVSSGVWLRTHFRIMTSGEAPKNLQVEFSPIVALSSFAYVLVAYCFWLRGCPVECLLFLLITVTSLMSDSVRPGSRTWCFLDRSLGTSGVLLCPGRALAFFADSMLLRAEIVGVFIFAVLFLAWSRESTCQKQFVLRHTCWHAVSALGLMWMAFTVPYPTPLTASFTWQSL